MRNIEAINYHNSGVFKAGGERIIPGNIRQGVQQPSAVQRYGFDYFNNPELSKAVLESIRGGINSLFRNLDTIINSSVMYKYIEEMVDENNLPLLDNHYVERLIPAVYQTVLAETKRRYNPGGGVDLNKIFAYASELSWDWLCLFWYEDSDRLLAQKEWALDFSSRGVRVRSDYCKLYNEFNSGYDLYHSGSELNQAYIEAKNQSLEKAITLSGIVAGKATVEGPVVSEEVFKHLDPYVYERMEQQERENNRKLEVEARAKRTIKSLTSNVKIESSSTPMSAAIQMKDVASKPIVINDIPEEENMLYGNQQNILVNYLNQPILTRNGQSIQIDPNALAGIQGAIQQKVINGQLVFDNQGLPIVVVIMQNGQEQLIDLNGQQQHFYYQLVHQAQQPNGLVPQQPQQQYTQPQQQYSGLVPQQQQQAPAHVSPEAMDIPGMEFAGDVEFAKNTNASHEGEYNAHLGLTYDVYQPAAGNETTQPSGLVPPKEEPVIEEAAVLPKDHYFWLDVDGEDHPAALLTDEEYISKKMMPVPVMLASSHARGVVYINKQPIEFVVERNKFMNREKHLGYILHREKGEYLSHRATEEIIENVNEATFNTQEVKVKVTDELIGAFSVNELLTTSALLQARDGGARTLIAAPFTMEETLPFVGVPFAEIVDNEAEEKAGKLTHLLGVLTRARELEPALYLYMKALSDWWITEVIYNRLGVERSSLEQIDCLIDYDKYQPFLAERGLMPALEAELEKDWEMFFSLTEEYIPIGTGAEEELTEEDLEEELTDEEAPVTEEDLVAQANVLLSGGDLEDAEKARAETVEVVEDDAINTIVQNTGGYIINIGQMSPPEEIGIHEIVDPQTSEALWTTLLSVFRRIPYAKGQNQYLYVGTGTGDLLLFKCEDPELGFIRLIGRRK